MTHTIEEIEKAIRESMTATGIIGEDSGSLGEGTGLDELDVVEIVMDLEERLETGCEITIPEEDILKMTAAEFARELHRFLEAQEG